MTPSYQQSVADDRSLVRDNDAGRTELKVVVGGNANVDFMVPALRVQLAAEGFGSSVRATAFGNWISETFTPMDADVWVIWLSAMGATRGMTTRLDIDLAAVSSAVTRLIDRGARVIIIPPEPLIAEEDPFSPFCEWRAGIIAELRRSLPTAAVVLPVEHVVRRLGIDSWTATRYWEQAKAPCHPDAASAVGSELGVAIARLFKPAVRVVVVDLDDTLWGGLVGEVGPEGLELDPDGLGRSYLELQQFLRDVSERGVPIAVVTKNDDDQARRPFTERSEMLLSLDSFVSFAASWQPKYEAIADLAQKLNVGIDSICFLDDSLLERDEARRMLPGLIVPELPTAPGKRVEFLIRSRLFTSPVLSDEDKRRVEYYKRSLQVMPENLDDYLASLDMVLEPLVIDHTNRDRVLSLLHKTNQFNVTLWRPSPAELSTFLDSAGNYAYAFRLTDRLGDAGIIAVVLAESGNGLGRLSAWVMSCRVFGRGLEYATAEHLSAWLATHEINDLDVPFVRGPRNSLVPAVLASVGLRPKSDDSDPVIYSGRKMTVPHHHLTIGAR